MPWLWYAWCSAGLLLFLWVVVFFQFIRTMARSRDDLTNDRQKMRNLADRMRKDQPPVYCIERDGTLIDIDANKDILEPLLCGSDSLVEVNWKAGHWRNYTYLLGPYADPSHPRWQTVPDMTQSTGTVKVQIPEPELERGLHKWGAQTCAEAMAQGDHCPHGDCTCPYCRVRQAPQTKQDHCGCGYQRGNPVYHQRYKVECLSGTDWWRCNVCGDTWGVARSNSDHHWGPHTPTENLCRNCGKTKALRPIPEHFHDWRDSNPCVCGEPSPVQLSCTHDWEALKRFVINASIPAYRCKNCGWEVTATELSLLHCSVEPAPSFTKGTVWR